MSKKIGLVGYGYWGPNILRNLFETPDCEVLYVCDKDISRLKEVRKRYPSVIITTDFNDLVNDGDIDGIIIAVPTKYHFSLAKTALEKNKDILVEKPFTLNSEEAEILNSLAKKQKRVLMVDNTFLFNEAVLQVKKIIDDGSIGKIIYIDSTRINLGLFQDDINVIFDLATHDFSIIQFLLNQQPTKVLAYGKSHFNKQEDVADIIAEYKDGVFANVHVSWLSPLKVRRMQIIGTKKMIVYDDIEQSEKIKIFDKGVDIEKGLTKKLELAKISYRSGDAWMPNVRSTEALLSLTKEFVRAMTERNKYKSGGDFSVGVVKTLETATLSARSGKSLILKKNGNK